MHICMFVADWRRGRECKAECCNTIGQHATKA